MTLEKTNSQQEKKSLEETSQGHLNAMEQELEDVIGKAKKIATSALIIGSGFALSYYLVKKLTGSNKGEQKKEKRSGKRQEVVMHKQPSLIRTVSNVALTELSIFLLAIAKEKIIEYLENVSTREDEHPTDAPTAHR